MLKKMLSALELVVATCLAVVILAPLVLQALPALFTLVILLYLLYLALGGPRYRDR